MFQIYDYQQMFDSIDLEKAICDIYDVGLNDDNLSLLYKANVKIQRNGSEHTFRTFRETNYKEQYTPR